MEIILIAIVAFLIGILAKTYIPRATADLRRRLATIKTLRSYWVGIVIMLIVFGVGYGLLFFYLSSSTMFSDYIGIMNTVMTLTFAVYIGNYAFMQLLESKYDRVYQEARRYLRDGDFDRALAVYQKLEAMDPEKIMSLLEQLEMTIILDVQGGRDRLIAKLSKMKLGKNETVIFRFLTTADLLFKEELASAKEKIADLVLFVEDNGVKTIGWAMDEIKQSSRYTSLSETSEAKKIFNDLTAYVKDTLSKERRAGFVAGQYVELPIQDSLNVE